MFKDGQWHVCYLEIPHEPLRHMGFMHSAVISSTDLIRWETRVVSSDDQHQPWWLIANIIRDGTTFSFCNGPQGINLYLSHDFQHWTSYAHNPVIPYASSDAARLRDPSLFEYKDQGEFWMVFTARKKSELPHEYTGVFYHSRSKDLFHWTAPTLLFDPGNINEPECPDLFQLGDRYYLLCGPSQYHRTGSGQYWVADNPNGPWRRPRLNGVGGSDLAVPNTATDGSRRLLFGWVPTHQGNQDFGRFEWAGHLAFPRQLYVGENDILYERLPDEFLALRAELLFPRPYPTYERRLGIWEIQKEFVQVAPGQSYGEILANGEYERFEMLTTVTFAQSTLVGGFVFRVGDSRFPGYEIAVDLQHQKLLLRPHLEQLRYLAFQSIDVKPDVPMTLRVFVDGNLVEAFLDDRFSLVGRTYTQTGNHRVGFFAHGGGFRASTPQIFALKTVYPDEGPGELLNLRPQVDPKYASGRCILFPRASANVHTPFDPVLNFTGSFTLECWIKRTPGMKGFKSNLIVKGDGQRPGYHYGLNLMRDRSLQLFLKTPSGFAGHESAPGSVAEEAQWVHLAGVLDASRQEIRLYKNGQCIGRRSNITGTATPDNDGALRLGFAAGIPGADPFFGLMDEVRIWNLARTDPEILRNFHRPLEPGDRQGLVLYWNFDQVYKDPAGKEFFANLAGSSPCLQASCYDGAEIFGENCFPMDDEE